MKLIKSIIYLLLFTVFIGCSQEIPDNLFIENHNNEEFAVKINGEDYSIEPKSTFSLGLDVGSHTLQFKEKVSSLNIEEKSEQNKYLFNPLNEKYVMEELIYEELTLGKSITPDKLKILPFNQIIVKESIPITGPYKVTQDVIIRNFDFLNTPSDRLPVQLGKSTINRVLISSYENFLIKLSKKNPALLKLSQLEMLGINEKSTDITNEENYTNYKTKRDKLINEITAEISDTEGSPKLILAILEINVNNNIAFFSVNKDKEVNLLNSNNQEKQGVIKDCDSFGNSFFSNMYKSKREFVPFEPGGEKGELQSINLSTLVDNFSLPENNMVHFHTIMTNGKFTTKKSYSELTKDYGKGHTWEDWELEFAQGMKALECSLKNNK